ncbi:hypothetical protein EDEG_01707 [Edhazardia aedis USNM 41457]|uniref:Uncharacterized protein n=1 Tax=Edhazardia aedis (strain USNM 41457) TaxID=1003232 RepID=J9D892_EDHAE|nr:hypothetical protein EDEG_01707 [Edhazardia aedis USNM 41457]|eukprot:EJW03996.1 hypothetical protein EDEG_01707 [Edhazardia aedis USNM 41457]
MISTLKMGKSHDQFMTEKERNYVAFCLSKNVSRGTKYIDYSIFFNNNKIKEKDKNHTEDEKLSSKVKNLNLKAKEKCEKMEQQRAKLKELLKTSLGRTVKKSKKIPRVIVQKELRLRDTLQAAIKIENLFYLQIILKHNLISKKLEKFGCSENESITFESSLKHINSSQGTSNGLCAEKLEFENTNSFENSEDSTKCCRKLLDLSVFDISSFDFIDFMTIPKFYKLLPEIFATLKDSAINLSLFKKLLQYSARINLTKEFKDMVNKSHRYFPDVTEQDLIETEYFENFNFNICSVVLAIALLLEKEYMAQIFFRNVVDENLELLFTLEEDKTIWQFLSILVRYCNDEQKGTVIMHLNDKIIEATMSVESNKLAGLSLFLDAIGIEPSDVPS